MSSNWNRSTSFHSIGELWLLPNPTPSLHPKALFSDSYMVAMPIPLLNMSIFLVLASIVSLFPGFLSTCDHFSSVFFIGTNPSPHTIVISHLLPLVHFSFDSLRSLWSNVPTFVNSRIYVSFGLTACFQPWTPNIQAYPWYAHRLQSHCPSSFPLYSSSSCVMPPFYKSALVWISLTSSTCTNNSFLYSIIVSLICLLLIISTATALINLFLDDCLVS